MKFAIQHFYLALRVYCFLSNFPPNMIIRTTRLLGTLEYVILTFLLMSHTVSKVLWFVLPVKIDMSGLLDKREKQTITRFFLNTQT